MKTLLRLLLPVVLWAVPATAQELRSVQGDRTDMPAGLVLWLDADHEAKQRGLQADGPPVTLDSWRDRSESGLRFTQPAAECQPYLVPVADRWVVRFAGQRQHLRAERPGLAFKELTLFIVARPTANPGGFRALFATNAPNLNDYQTGLTVDLGPGFTRRLSFLNVEGRGFEGAQNLIKTPIPLGRLTVLCVVVSREQALVHLELDGTRQNARSWQPADLRADELTVGARHYRSGVHEPWIRGFFQGDIAEVILFDRVLTDRERKQLTRRLRWKYRKVARQLQLEAAAAESGGKRTVENPPPVQPLVPGFVVRELPVRLKNINNVRYRRDGTLVALGYNGNIYLLTDRDGDGLEEHVRLFWENDGQLVGPIGMALTPPAYRGGRGVFVASKGRVSLIVDTDGDDRADTVRVIASGWEPLPHGVDALGVAVDEEGNVYFGLGTANFGNPYLLDGNGRPHYSLDSPRGTIQKISADFKRRTTVCTGIRFSVALAFNRFGDLFCTDQEGATWLPNGNPFDELLWIRPGRHYGFPPRHPRYLPDVVDEPSVYDYGPQHQSTCGLVFNEPIAPGYPIFGPSWWRGDAFVCGESRGTLYRTTLARTAYGYVARTQILARLQHLTVDACVSPDGQLLVATHSGLPDWGTGPEGMGRLFKLTPVHPAPPRPVFAYAASPTELHVVFDRPLDPASWGQVASKARLIYGRFVRAGERYETLAPPYQVVQIQATSRRYQLPVYDARVAEDEHTLVLRTGPQARGLWYALTLPRTHDSGTGKGLPQEPFIDVDYTLEGALAEVANKRGQMLWSGWLPHLDLDAARQFTAASPRHRRLWQLASEGTRWTLRAQLRLDHMLRPERQIGTRLDEPLPPEEVTVRFTANCPLELSMPTDASVRRASGRGPVPPVLHDRSEPVQDGWWQEFTVTVDQKIAWPVALRLYPGKQPPRLVVAFRTRDDRRWRPLPCHKVLLPWATVERKHEGLGELGSMRPELRDASWGRGRRLFFGEKAACSKCHRIRGQGGQIGPDLSNLIHRDYTSVRRDILEPSYAINPDFVSYRILTTDGRVFVGPIRSDGDDLVIGTGEGDEVRIARADVEVMQPVTQSIMPDDIGKRLNEAELRDLLAFLLLPPPRMPLMEDPAPPVPRLRSDVLARLGQLRQVQPKPRPLRIVLVAGPKDHGPNEHDYPAWQRAWAELLRGAEGVQVVTRWQWPEEDDYATADVIVFYKRMDYRRSEGQRMDRLLARGKGLVFVHWAVHGGEAPEELARRIGLASGRPIAYRHGPLVLRSPGPAASPIVRGLERLDLVDESYWNLVRGRSDMQVLLVSHEEGRDRPQVWLVDRRPGRVFVCIPGHYSWTFDDPLYRLLLLRGIAWAAGEPVDRFVDLIWPGARVR